MWRINFYNFFSIEILEVLDSPFKQYWKIYFAVENH